MSGGVDAISALPDPAFHDADTQCHERRAFNFVARYRIIMTGATCVRRDR